MVKKEGTDSTTKSLLNKRTSLKRTIHLLKLHHGILEHMADLQKVIIREGVDNVTHILFQLHYNPFTICLLINSIMSVGFQFPRILVLQDSKIGNWVVLLSVVLDALITIQDRLIDLVKLYAPKEGVPEDSTL